MMNTRFHFSRLGSVLLAFVAMATFPGCQSVSTAQLEKAPSQLKKGVTTKADVKALYGDPDRRRVNANGETWLYGAAYDRDGGEEVVGTAIGICSGFIPVPYVGTAISGLRTIGRSAESREPSAAMQFDHRGILRDYAIDLP